MLINLIGTRVDLGLDQEVLRKIEESMIGEMTTLIRIILSTIITILIEKKKEKGIEKEINREKKKDLNTKKEEEANRNPDPDREIEKIRESLKEKDIQVLDLNHYNF